MGLLSLLPTIRVVGDPAPASPEEPPEKNDVEPWDGTLMQCARKVFRVNSLTRIQRAIPSQSRVHEVKELVAQCRRSQ